MADPFIGEIRVVGFNFAPRGWASCNGQLLPISQNTHLFSILGTFWGGDGRSTFALPDLIRRTAVAWGQGSGLSDYQIGQSGGVETISLLQSEIPAHAHTVRASPDPGEVQAPAADRSLARSSPGFLYRTDTSSNLVAMAPETLAPAGGGQPHNNWSPALVVHYVIALQGIHPPRP